MPGQDQKIVGIQLVRFFLRDDGYMGSGREAAELVFIDFRNRGDVFRGEATELKNDVPLGGSSISEQGFSLGPHAAHQVLQSVTVAEYVLPEYLVRRGGVQRSPSFVGDEV